jgi:hypothetical protein
MQVAAIPASIPDLDDPVSPANQRLMLVLVLMSSIVAVLIGSLLVLLRDRLANRLFPPATESLSSRELHAVALSVLGAYFVVQGLAQLVWAWHFNWSSATQLVLGVGLFFGARAVSRLWWFGRSAGTRGSVDQGAV